MTRSRPGLLLLASLALTSACHSTAEREARVTRVLEDARGSDESFARHFGPNVGPTTLASWKASLAKEGPAKFEEKAGPLCVRAYWGEWVIDHSYYFFFETRAAKSPVVSVEYEGGFGASMAGLGRHGGARSESVLQRCKALNGGPP